MKQNYSKISSHIQKFAQEFLNKLFENIDIDKPEFEINYYHQVLFAYMVNSNLPLKDLYFNRISALIGENSDLKEINDQLDDIENISLYKENENSNIILFDYNNINKNKISFLLEKKISEKNRDKKNKKGKSFSSNLEMLYFIKKII